MLVHGTADPTYSASVDIYGQASPPKAFVTLVNGPHIPNIPPWVDPTVKSTADFFDGFLKAPPRRVQPVDGRRQCPRSCVAAGGRTALAGNHGSVRAGDGVTEDLDDLLGAVGGRHRRPVDLLERMGELGVVEGDDRLSQRRRESRLERRVPLPILVAEADHDDVRAAQQRLRADRVHPGAFVVLPEPLRLRSEDVDADIVGRAVIGDRGEQLDRQPGGGDALGDPLAPVGVDLAR